LAVFNEMPLFLTTLRQGGPSFTIEDVDDGFIIHPVLGREAGFSGVARLCMEKSGSTFTAFPRPDGRGGYDQVLIIPTAEQQSD